jgi:hypothetical protein
MWAIRPNGLTMGLLLNVVKRFINMREGRLLVSVSVLVVI